MAINLICRYCILINFNRFTYYKMDGYQLERLYINTFAFIGIMIIAAIQFGILYKFGLKGGIIFAIVFSFLFSFGRQLLLSYARGMGDSKGTGPSHEFELFSSPLLISLALFAVYSFGMHVYIAYHKTGVLNKPVFFSWLIICIGAPVLFFSIKTLRTHLTGSDHSKNYIRAQFQIFHYNELPIFIETLKIKNTTNDKEAEIQILNQSRYRSDEFLNQLNIWDKTRCSNPAEEPNTTFIPLNSNELYLSWYSPVEGTYYSDVLKFPINNFEPSTEADGQMILNIQLEIFPKGKVYLYTTKEGKRHTYQVKSKAINEKEKTRFIELFDLYTDSKNQNTFTDTHNIENLKRLQTRIDIEESLFKLSYNISAPGDLNSIHFDDRRYWGYNSTFSTLNTSSLKPLPYNITLNFTNTGNINLKSTTIFFDKEKLYKTIESLTKENKDMPVEIFISIKGIDKENFEVLVKGDNQSIVFTDWERHYETED
ncbi:MAG: hypothetical protein J7604_07225 [Sporocytophaga sp.]|uniref:hypothetical protein n=1 Tax=Sporocytophaga sp. TaxID=2231183 RepID=UPI001B1C165F|nr:hypothetical protein [Sporocytophaga sp.]MBO9699985.1 hypothetical protein [Sporocytophaga sp.]